MASAAGGPEYSRVGIDRVRAEPGVAAVEPAYISQMTNEGRTLVAWGVHAATFLDEPLVDGRWLSPEDEASDEPAIIVGSSAARVWHLHPGSVVTFSAAAGPARFTVVGVGASNATNGFNVYTTLGALQRAAGRPDAVNSLLVRSSDSSDRAIDRLAGRLEDILDDA